MQKYVYCNNLVPHNKASNEKTASTLAVLAIQSYEPTGFRRIAKYIYALMRRELVCK